jgi:hypothetical protein
MSDVPMAPDGDRPRTPRGVRRVGIGAVVGSAGALAATWVLSYGTGPVSQEPEPFTAPAGACLDWTSPDGADVARVDCQQPHLFEAVGPVSLTTAFGPAASFPAEDAWPSIVIEKCTPLVTEFMEDRYDPLGRFSVGALKPSQPGWRNGDRTLHCGLQVVAQSGELYRTMGAARGQDQADVHEPGTCLAIDGVDAGDPVDCALPHAVEVVGTMDFAAPFPEADYPDEGRQDAAAEPVCTKLADDYAGGPGIVAEKKLTVYWDTLSLESWKAGTRKVDCKLAALLPDKSGLAPVTGSVRGAVAIGTTPAPPTSATATPGAPAPVPPVGPTPGPAPVESAVPSTPPST